MNEYEYRTVVFCIVIGYIVTLAGILALAVTHNKIFLVIIIIGLSHFIYPLKKVTIDPLLEEIRNEIEEEERLKKKNESHK